MSARTQPRAVRTDARSRRVTALARLALASVLAVTVLGGLPSAAHAADNGDFSVAPFVAKGHQPRDFFVVNVPAGKSAGDAVSVVNTTKSVMHFRLYAADAYNTAVGGGLTVRGIDEAQQTVGSWLRLPTRTLTVPPMTRATVPFVLAVPEGTQPGDYVGGIVAVDAALQLGAVKSAAQVAVRRQVASRVYVRVAGALTPGIAVRDVHIDRSGRHATVRYVVANTGNVRLTPKSDVALTGMFGRVLHTVPSTTLPELIPGQQAQFSAPVGSVPFVDYVTARVEITTAKAYDSGADRALVVPWWVLVVLAVLVTAWVARRLRRRSRPPARHGSGATAPAEVERV